MSLAMDDHLKLGAPDKRPGFLVGSVQSRSRRGFTIVEMLTTVSVLIIVLGLMISLARHVRRSSADQLTKDILHQLDQAMAIYIHRNDDMPPVVPALIDDSHGMPSEAMLQQAARLNNQSVIHLLKSEGLLNGRLTDVPYANYDEVYVCDSWGSPIVFMPQPHPAIGMNAKGWFFFSAGPDGRYLTRDDNLYSYDPGAQQ
jgi:type II secretory pathway pseudopilin PulG